MSPEPRDEVDQLGLPSALKNRIVRRIYGSADFIRGDQVYCLWIEDKDLNEAMSYQSINSKIAAVRELRLASTDAGANDLAQRAHQFREMRTASRSALIVPRITSELRDYLPFGLISSTSVASSQNFLIPDTELWVASVVCSKMHLSWASALCGRLEMRLMYSNTICWNTFPIPLLTSRDKADLTRCAEDILLAREAHFPATIAEMYDPERMDRDFPDLRRAHERNDETLERIYIGRRFRNDTERLEHLFALYTKMTVSDASPVKKGASKSARKTRSSEKVA